MPSGLLAGLLLAGILSPCGWSAALTIVGAILEVTGVLCVIPTFRAVDRLLDGYRDAKARSHPLRGRTHIRTIVNGVLTTDGAPPPLEDRVTALEQQVFALGGSTEESLANAVEQLREEADRLANQLEDQMNTNLAEFAGVIGTGQRLEGKAHRLALPLLILGILAAGAGGLLSLSVDCR